MGRDMTVSTGVNNSKPEGSNDSSSRDSFIFLNLHKVLALIGCSCSEPELTVNDIQSKLNNFWGKCKGIIGNIEDDLVQDGIQFFYKVFITSTHMSRYVLDHEVAPPNSEEKQSLRKIIERLVPLFPKSSEFEAPDPVKWRGQRKMIVEITSDLIISALKYYRPRTNEDKNRAEYQQQILDHVQNTVEQSRSFALSMFCSQDQLENLKKVLANFDKETDSIRIQTLVAKLLKTNDTSIEFNVKELEAMQELKELITNIDETLVDLFERIAKFLQSSNSIHDPETSKNIPMPRREDPDKGQPSNTI